MWQTDTRWFDVAVVMTIFAVGNILFGRFEEHKLRWQRLLKVAVVLGAVVGLASTVGRVWAYAPIVVLLGVAAWVHLVWLPRQGINGWTAEPRDRYLELVSKRRRG
jgi:hypothetical protein